MRLALRAYPAMLVAASAWLIGCAEPLPTATPPALRVTNTSAADSPRQPANLTEAHRLAVVGSLSCAASGCHGKPTSATPNWESAYSVWMQNDPHRKAFEVLYTERSVQMFRKLTQHQDEAIPEETYLRFLEQKCVGCHATPAAGSSVAGGIVPATSAETYAQGVNCESCHGSAGDWLHRHYLKSWPGADSAARTTLPEKHGFKDTLPLASRAGVCVDCHVGPQVFGDVTFDVNHDLIAAGHPRLAFEFQAYLGNLPPHWDVAKDHARESGAFHFNAWQAGQWQTARQQAELLATRAERAKAKPAAAWPEFASYDCYDCHHTLGAQAYRQQRVSQGNVRRGLARPALVSLAQVGVAATPGSQPAADLHSALLRLQDELASWSQIPANSGSYREVANQLDGLASKPSAALSAQQRAEIVARLIGRLRTAPDRPFTATWDDVVQGLLAARALAADLPAGTLDAELSQLDQCLRAALAGPTQYDSPTGFAPQDAALQDSLLSLENALLTVPNKTAISPDLGQETNR